MTDDYCRQEHKCSDNNHPTTENIESTETDHSPQASRTKAESLRQLFTPPSKTDDTLHNTERTSVLVSHLSGEELREQQQCPISQTHDMPSLPKPGQKYWLSSEAKKRKNEYMREYYIRKKEALLQLQEHQLKPRDLKLLMLNDQVVSRHLGSDGDYVKVIDELLGTLLDNKIVKDYDLR